MADWDVMCDQGKESGSALSVGWESDLKEQKCLHFMSSLLPLKTLGLLNHGSRTALSSKLRDRRQWAQKGRAGEIWSRHRRSFVVPTALQVYVWPSITSLLNNNSRKDPLCFWFTKLFFIPETWKVSCEVYWRRGTREWLPASKH